MVPTQTTLSALFQVQRRFSVPLYQRQYVWSEDNHTRMWEMTLDRIEQRVRGREPKPRFLGTIVVSPYSTGNSLRTDLIVDGQQRLTTLQLLLAAFRDISIERGATQAVGLMDSMTTNLIGPEQSAVERFKVTPTKLDQAQFELCMSSRSAGAVRKSSANLTVGNHLRLVAAYQRFHDWIIDYLDDSDYGATPDIRSQHLLQVLMNDLLLVAIDLNQGEDPQEIFETLNFGGTPLAPSDLLRNWLLLRASQNKEDMNALYDEYWRPFDAAPWTDSRAVARRVRLNVDIFVHHYLTAVTGEAVNADKLYSEYKNWSEKQQFSKVEQELMRLERYSHHWLAVMNMKGRTPIERLARVAVLFEVGPAVPFILALSECGELSHEDRDAIAVVVESFIIRREICRLTAKNYNNILLAFIQALQSPASARAVIHEALLKGTGKSAKWPTDAEFREAMVVQPLYDKINTRRLQWVLWELEESLRTKKTEALDKPGSLQVEHIMPVGWHVTWPLKSGGLAPADHDDMANWFNDGPEYKETRERNRVIHTLGNLTLITASLNQSYGNDPFVSKTTEIKQHSLLSLNCKVVQELKWDVEQIAARSTELSSLALRRWPRMQS